MAIKKRFDVPKNYQSEEDDALVPIEFTTSQTYIKFSFMICAELYGFKVTSQGQFQSEKHVDSFVSFSVFKSKLTFLLITLQDNCTHELLETYIRVIHPKFNPTTNLFRSLFAEP